MKKSHIFLYGALSIVIIFVIPIIVSNVYRQPAYCSFLVAEWEAETYLGYIGSFLGAAATIYAVRATIVHERKQQENARIIAVKPWLASETQLLNSNGEIQCEENGRTIFVFLNGDSFGSTKNLPYMIKKGPHEINKKDCVIKYGLTNVGGNTATGLSFTLDGKPLLPDFALAKDCKKEFIFILPLRENDEKSSYNLKFSYGDIVSNTRYWQTETLNVAQAEHGVTFTQGMNDLLTEPQEEGITNGKNANGNA